MRNSSNFIPYEKLGKKQKRFKNSRKRKQWQISPITKVVTSKKIYKRERKNYYDEGYSD